MNAVVEDDFEMAIGDRSVVIHLAVYAPCADPSGDYRCRYELTGDGVQRSVNMAGVTSLQAFLLALKIAAVELSGYATRWGGQLSGPVWEHLSRLS